MTDTKSEEEAPPNRVMVISKDGSEITDEELEQVAGGARSKYSKTIDLTTRSTDVDEGF